MTDYQTKLAAARAASERLEAAHKTAAAEEEALWDRIHQEREAASEAIAAGVEKFRLEEQVAWAEATAAWEAEKAAIAKGQKP